MQLYAFWRLAPIPFRITVTRVTLELIGFAASTRARALWGFS